MKSSVFVLLLLMLLVEVSLAAFKAFKLCPEKQCRCSRPKDIENISEKVKDVNFRYGCICICAISGSQECGKNEDCAEGFDCRQVGRRRKCVCPCDDMNNPYCPSPYSKCVMRGTKPKCKCSTRYACNGELLLPKCVFWADRTVYDYRNPCFFVRETCDKSRNDLRWKEFPYGCEHVPHCLDNVVRSVTYQGKIEHLLSEEALANSTILGWDPYINDNYGIHAMYMQRPQPEPEPEAEPFSYF